MGGPQKTAFRNRYKEQLPPSSRGRTDTRATTSKPAAQPPLQLLPPRLLHIDVQIQNTIEENISYNDLSDDRSCDSSYDRNGDSNMLIMSSVLPEPQCHLIHYGLCI